MTLNQISVFVENKPGKMELLTNALAQNQINLRALSLAETSDFGIVRIIADDIPAASAVLAPLQWDITPKPSSWAICTSSLISQGSRGASLSTP